MFAFIESVFENVKIAVQFTRIIQNSNVEILRLVKNVPELFRDYLVLECLGYIIKCVLKSLHQTIMNTGVFGASYSRIRTTCMSLFMCITFTFIHITFSLILQRYIFLHSVIASRIPVYPMENFYNSVILFPFVCIFNGMFFFKFDDNFHALLCIRWNTFFKQCICYNTSARCTLILRFFYPFYQYLCISKKVIPWHFGRILQVSNWL